MIYQIITQERGGLGVAPACSAMGVSRNHYADWLKRPQTKTPAEDDAALIESIRAIVDEFPRYGYRRVSRQLKREGVCANSKKVLEIMRKKGFLCKRRRFRVCTTNSKHGLPTYPNLAKDLRIVRLNQLWVADITYVGLLRENVYLATIMDVFSRRCIGWALSRNIDAQLCLDALAMAFDTRKGTDLNELVHHSDQGVQYASKEYTTMLERHGIRISMSRKGNPYDNAYAESLFKTIKYEEVYLTEYETFEDAHGNIKNFIEEVYNKKRLHSGIGYLPPAEFEQKILSSQLT